MILDTNAISGRCLFGRILAAKKADPKADVSELEAQINRIVYSVYGLTPDEIRIVEEGAFRAGVAESGVRNRDNRQVTRVADSD